MSVVAYHFWSPTCAPCKAIKPTIEDLKEEFSNVQWESVDISSDRSNIASQLSVSVVPTIAVVSRDSQGNRVSVEKHSGTAVAGYYRILRNALRSTQQS